jgi:hypothetical protein
MKSVKAKRSEFKPDREFEPGPNRVFVFGSNLSGHHGAGAALTAKLNYGAVDGEAFGLQSEKGEDGSRSYAIPTKSAKYAGFEPLAYTEIAYWVSEFHRWTVAAGEKYNDIFVTKIGCGLAGWSELEISALFRRYNWPDNVTLPHGWRK